MAGERRRVRRIFDAAARQVTFSKRRRGLFKKAEELAVLCDADVALIVFSCSGHLFDFSSSDMKRILEKHQTHSKNLQKVDKSSIDLNSESDRFATLRSQVEEATLQLRQMRGDALEGLKIDELQQLEDSLEAGLCRVSNKTGKLLMQQIHDLQQKGVELMEENKRLHDEVMQVCSSENRVGNQTKNFLSKDGQPSESAVIALSSQGSPDNDGRSDTCLKLGLP